MFQSRAENGIAAASPVRISRLAIITVCPMLKRFPSAPETRPWPALHGLAPSPARMPATTPSVSAIATTVPAADRNVALCWTATAFNASDAALIYATSATGLVASVPAIARASVPIETELTEAS